MRWGRPSPDSPSGQDNQHRSDTPGQRPWHERTLLRKTETPKKRVWLGARGRQLVEVPPDGRGQDRSIASFAPGAEPVAVVVPGPFAVTSDRVTRPVRRSSENYPVPVMHGAKFCDVLVCAKVKIRAGPQAAEGGCVLARDVG